MSARPRLSLFAACFCACALAIGWSGCGALFAQSAAQSPAEPQQAAPHHREGAAEGAHRRFENAQHWAKVFDDPERDGWQKPEEVLGALDLKNNSVVADIGAGTGYFSVRIAKRVPEGKVLAADIEPDMVRYLGERARQEGLANLIPVLSDAGSAKLPERADVILFVDTYHHIANRVEYFAKLKASLGPKGRLAIIDFKPDSVNGPPPKHRIAAEQVERELNAAGYALVKAHPFLPRQYFLVFEKRDG